MHFCNLFSHFEHVVKAPLADHHPRLTHAIRSKTKSRAQAWHFVQLKIGSLINLTNVAAALVRTQGPSEMDRTFCSSSSSPSLLFWARRVPA